MHISMFKVTDGFQKDLYAKNGLSKLNTNIVERQLTCIAVKLCNGMLDLDSTPL